VITDKRAYMMFHQGWKAQLAPGDSIEAHVSEVQEGMRIESLVCDVQEDEEGEAKEPWIAGLVQLLAPWTETNRN
jgi:hypothetical protein